MGGGMGMGNRCKPMAVSFQCMTKFITNKKKKERKKKNRNRFTNTENKLVVTMGERDDGR